MNVVYSRKEYEDEKKETSGVCHSLICPIRKGKDMRSEGRKEWVIC